MKLDDVCLMPVRDVLFLMCLVAVVAEFVESSTDDFSYSNSRIEKSRRQEHRHKVPVQG